MAASRSRAADLDPYYDRVEQVLGVRERTDWTKSVRTVEPGFKALGAELEPVHSYTDVNCMSCGSCLQGCPTNAGKSTQNTYIHEAWARGLLELRAEAAVERVLIEDARGDGRRVRRRRRASATRVRAGAVVVAAGALNTPQLLLRSGRRQRRDRAGTSACTRSGSCTGSSTSRRTRTWSTRSPPTAWTTSTTRTAAS